MVLVSGTQCPTSRPGFAKSLTEKPPAAVQRCSGPPQLEDHCLLSPPTPPPPLSVIFQSSPREAFWSRWFTAAQCGSRLLGMSQPPGLAVERPAHQPGVASWSYRKYGVKRLGVVVVRRAGTVRTVTGAALFSKWCSIGEALRDSRPLLPESPFHSRHTSVRSCRAQSLLWNPHFPFVSPGSSRKPVNITGEEQISWRVAQKVKKLKDKV